MVSKLRIIWKHQAADGVLCCKTKAQQLADAPLLQARAKLGRKLTPINVSTYGWYYSY